MGTNFNNLSLRLSTDLQDTLRTSGGDITSAADDGKRRTSLQRSQDIMAARYWIWGIFRVLNKTLFYTVITPPFIGTGVGYYDLSGLNVTSARELSLVETSILYNKPIIIVDGDELQAYVVSMRTHMVKEIVAGVVNDGTAKMRPRLRIMLGAALPQQDLSLYTFELGFYDNPRLEELTAASSLDLTEPRIWWDAIERYAESVSWRGAGDLQRAAAARNEAKDIVLSVVQREHGEEAKQIAQKYLTSQGG